MLVVKLNDNGTLAELNRVAEGIKRPAAMLKAVGRRGANELKAHFRARNRTPNKLGGRPRSNFWSKVADAVNSPVLEGSSTVRISIANPYFAQKVFGGPIKPNRAGALTIPVDPLAYGRPARVFQQETGIQLFLLRKKGGGISNLLAGLVSENKVTVFYVLSRGVDQEEDPEALPPKAKFNAAILDQANTEAARQLRARKSS